MLITGRRQGKYSNNLFKLNVDNDMLTYRSTQKDIVFKVQFHKYKNELYARVNEKHNSPNKAVAYELMDYGEYFIVKAIFEKHMNLPKTNTLYGAIGIDINVDHIALCETNKDGNIVLIRSIQSIKRIQRIREMKNCISWPLKSWNNVNPRRRVL